MDSSTPNTLSHEELMSHVSWVQNLARRLVSDPHQAEDLAQESVLAALSENAAPRAPRRFLAGVVRNLAHLGRRRRDRREQRELTAARYEATPSTFDEFERQATQSTVVEAVRELPPHYRDVLLLRYFEDLTPTAIAAQLDVPISTVKTRLARAQAQLRERLDRMHGGDGRSWLSALAPLLVEPRALRTASGAALPVAAWLCVTAALGTFALLAVRLSSEPATDTTQARAAVPTGLVAAPETPASPRPGDTGERAEAPDNASVLPSVIDGAMQPGIRLRGRVLDTGGSTVPFAVVRMRPYSEATARGERIAMTDAEGRFEFERYWPGGTLEAAIDEWTNVLVGETARGDPEAEVVVVVARADLLRGRVRNELGEPIAGAECELVLPDDHRTRFGASLGRSSTVRFLATSDDSGTFELAVPRMEGTQLRLRADGFEELLLPLEHLPAGFAELVLPARTVAGPTIAGRVFRVDGRPLEDASVTTGLFAETSDSQGRFEIAFRPGAEIIAFARGEGVAQFALGNEAPHGDIEMHLAPPSSLTGRVVDPAGNGLAGIGLWLVDPTPYTIPLVFPVEGAQAPYVERALNNERASRPITISGLDGSFTIEGLLEREYTLTYVDPTSYVRARATVDPRSGTPANLVLDPSAVRDVVRGRVVDTDGRTVQGADVGFMTRSGRSERTLSDVDVLRGETVKTGPDGSFLLRGVPLTHIVLEVRGASILNLDREFDGDGKQTLVVERAARLRVELTGFRGNEWFSALDSDGAALPLHHAEGRRHFVSERASIVDGRSAVVATSEACTTIRVGRGDATVAEQRIELRAGELAVARLQAER